MLIINKKGFTLVELLIVIAILAILAVGLVIAINPGEMLAQARDSQRMRDLNMLRDALVYSFTRAALSGDAAAPFFSACPAVPNHTAPTNITSTVLNIPMTGVPATTWPAFATQANLRLINNTGWIPFNFTHASVGGAPFGALPIDPINVGGAIGVARFYAFACTGTGSAATFELNTVLESTRHAGLMGADGGTQALFWETGTTLGL